MANVKIGKWEYDDDELEKQFEEARKRGQKSLKIEPRAKSAYYDRTSKRIIVELLNGCTFMFPANLAQGLRGASDEDLAEVEIMPFGFGLHWEKLDADFTVAGLLAGRFGTKRWMEELQRLQQATGQTDDAPKVKRG